MQPVVELWDDERVNVIVLAPTGIIYTNQTGGNACHQPEAEGFLVPLKEEFGFDASMDAPLYNDCSVPYDPVIAQEIIDYFADGRDLEPDPEAKLMEEAWVPVRIKVGANCVALKHLGGMQAILTYPNSD